MPAAADVTRADDDTLHAVYQAVLANLTLSQAHRDNLRNRGLSDQEIEQRGYKTHIMQGRARLARVLRDRFGDELLRVPGFYVKESDNGNHYLTIAGRLGMLIPVRDLTGRIVALRIRQDEGEPKYCWLSTANRGGAGSGARVHVPKTIATATKTIRITEGELKADIATSRSGILTLSIPGVGIWRPALEVLAKLECDTVRLAIDMDARDNPDVARALDEIAFGLVEAGYGLELETWPAEFKGIDDALVGGATVEITPTAQARAKIAEIVTAGSGDGGPPKILQGDAWEGDDDDREEAPLGHKAFKEFPFDALYPTLANFAIERGRAHKANPAMIALYGLSILAGCIGRSRVIRLNDTWFEVSAIFGCIIGDSTSKKSVMLRDAVGPAVEVDGELDAKSEREFQIYDELRAAYDSWKPNQGSERPGRPIEPNDQVLLADDVTMEAVGKWLKMNQRGMLFAFEELMEWFLGMGRYNNGDGSQEQRFWIGMFDGASKSSLRTKNVRRTRYLRLGSVTGGMTPSDWSDIAAPKAFSNGMIGRMLPIYPSKVLQTGTYVPPTAAVTNAYRDLVRNAAMLDREGTSSKGWTPPEMLMTPSAQREWDEWLEMWNAQVEDADGDIRTLKGRMKTYCARFALISSVCASIESHGPNVVDADDIRNAIVMSAWFSEEAERVYALGKLQIDPQKSKIARLIQRLRDRHGPRIRREEWHSVSVRELRHSNRDFWGESDGLREFLDGLVESGLLVTEGRQRGKRYFLKEKK
jgi:Protein of unknown function (DUF3987)/Domain of unknown function (DUF3854)